ncbi:MAG: hypothetical protein GEV03_26965 [Streptosporangiales bacterium]|nr:hypothetical protein [Streptosporangiales bacterium]
MRRLISIFLVSVPLTLGLAACGGDDGASVRSEDTSSGSASGTGTAAGNGVPDGVAAQYATLEEEIRAEGGETRSGEWRIAYIVEPAEPWFEPRDGRQSFREPAEGETHHIEIIPFEAETGRVVPSVPIRLEVVDSAGKVVDAKSLNLYYAEFFHYANNFAVPEAGTYTLRATLESPTFLRHGEKEEGPTLAEGTTVTFDGVELEPES